MKTKQTLIGFVFLGLISVALYSLFFGSFEPDTVSKRSTTASSVKKEKPSTVLLIDPGASKDAGGSQFAATNSKRKASAEEVVKGHDFEKARRVWEEKRKKQSGANRLKEAWIKKKNAKKGFSKKTLSPEDRKRWAKWAKAKSAYLEPKTLTIRGRLVDAKQAAIPGARLVLRGSAKLPDQTQNLATKSDEEGLFSISGTRYQFHLNIEAPPGFVGKSILVPWTDASEFDLGTIILSASSQLTGFVEDPDGAAIAGVTVKLFTVDDYAAYSRAENVAYTSQRVNPRAMAKTNNSGQFTLNAPAGDGVVVAEKNGFRSSEGFRLTSTVDRSRNQTLKLRIGQDVSIVVKDQDNKVLSGSSLRLLRFGELYNPEWNQPVLASGTTNSDGRVVFRNLTLRRYQVAVLIDNDAPSCQNFQVNFEKPTEIAVVVQRSVKVKGQLTSNSQDSTLPGGALLVYREGADGLQDRRQINAKVAVGGDGRFELGNFHTGRYVLFIQPGAGFFPATKHFEVASGGADLDLGSIELRTLTTLKVQVRDAQSRGLKGCRFLVSPTNFDESRFVDGAGGRAVTDSEGAAMLVNMPTGQVVVAVLDSQQQILCYKAIEVPTQPDQSVTINVSGVVGGLHGTVSVAAGETFLGGQLELKPDGTQAPAFTIPVPVSGRFRKDSIPTGTYSVSFVPNRQMERLRLETVTISENRDLEQNFTLPLRDH